MPGIVSPRLSLVYEKR
jgi:hypothetical protein